MQLHHATDTTLVSFSSQTLPLYLDQAPASVQHHLLHFLLFTIPPLLFVIRAIATTTKTPERRDETQDTAQADQRGWRIPAFIAFYYCTFILYFRLTASRFASFLIFLLWSSDLLWLLPSSSSGMQEVSFSLFFLFLFLNYGGVHIDGSEFFHSFILYFFSHRSDRPPEWPRRQPTTLHSQPHTTATTPASTAHHKLKLEKCRCPTRCCLAALASFSSVFVLNFYKASAFWFLLCIAFKSSIEGMAAGLGL